MSVKNGDMCFPAIGHIVSMNGKTWSFQTAVRPEKMDDAAGQFGIDGTPGKTKLPFVETSIVLCPDLKGFCADFCSIGQDDAVTEPDAYISAQCIAGGIGIIGAMLGSNNSFIMSFDNAFGAQQDGVTGGADRISGSKKK